MVLESRQVVQQYKELGIW